MLKFISFPTYMMLLFCSFSANAFPLTTHTEVSRWAAKQSERSLNQIFLNIKHAQDFLGARPGAILASPSATADTHNGEHQDYRYHWVRDAALVMHTLISTYSNSQDPVVKSKIREQVLSYIQFSKLNQISVGPNGLGEPKFHLDGLPYTGPWGRPQNDGPALRALTLMQWVQTLISEGSKEEAEQVFKEVVLTDLEYIIAKFGELSFDIWEDVKGQHFYVLLLQRSALQMAQKIEAELNLSNLAKHHHRQQEILEHDLSRFLSDQRGIIEASHNVVGGHAGNKESGLDISTIISVLFSNRFLSSQDETSYSVTDSWVLATAEALRSQFAQIFPINRQGLPGTLIGRYPEDRYFGGNPWPLATLAMAELHYRFAYELSELRIFKVDRLNAAFINQVLKEAGESPLPIGANLLPRDERWQKLQIAAFKVADIYMARIRYHASDEGFLHEQFHRESGYAMALSHLTWSHSAFLDTVAARQAAISVIPNHTCQELLNGR